MSNHVPLKTRIEIAERLKEVLTITPGGDFCIYNDPHSDHTIAEEFGCTHANVASVRRELYGNIRQPNNQGSQIVKRLEDLERLYLEQNEIIERQNARIDRMEYIVTLVEAQNTRSD